MRKGVKKLLFISIILLIAAGLILPAGGCAKEVALTVTWALATTYPADDGRAEGLAYWAELVEKETGGKVKLDIHYAGELVGGKEQFAATASGAIDGCLNSASYFTGEVPAIEVFILPLPPPEVTQYDYWDIWRNNRDFFTAEVEKQGCKPLMAFPLGDFAFLVGKGPIHDASDINGLTIRVAGGKVLPKSVELFGAASARIASAEIYPALQRGTVDSVITANETYVTHSLYEVAPYCTNCSWYGGMYYLLINLATWDNLTPDLQQTVMECSEKAEAWAGKHMIEGADLAVKRAQEKAKEYYFPPEEELARWSATVKPIWYEWAEDIGPQGQKLLDMWLK